MTRRNEKSDSQIVAFGLSSSATIAKNKMKKNNHITKRARDTIVIGSVKSNTQKKYLTTNKTPTGESERKERANRSITEGMLKHIRKELVISRHDVTRVSATPKAHTPLRSGNSSKSSIRVNVQCAKKIPSSQKTISSHSQTEGQIIYQISNRCAVHATVRNGNLNIYENPELLNHD